VLTHVLILALSLLLTLLFFLYGFNLYYLLVSAARYRVPPLPRPMKARPRVAIHLPIYNERYVIRRIAAACARMAVAYGTDSVRILLLDDSDDETRGEIDALAAEYLDRGIHLEVLRRPTRQGFKAGALQAALARTDEEFIALFDADFVPPPDFLNRAIPHLVQDERLGVVQSRWAHVNRDFNFLTRAIALGIDVHFLVEQPGRFASGCFLNFNGSGGVFRRNALIEAGGWQADTLAEDLDVSYRIQPRGYRILYLQDLESPGEIPPTVPSFKKQQARWACGSLRTARKLLPGLLGDSKISHRNRLEAALHLTNYMIHPLMFASFLLACLAALLGVDTLRFIDSAGLFDSFRQAASGGASAALLHNVIWVLLGSMILLSTVSAWIHPVVALRAQGMKVWRNLPSLVVLFLLGCGISLSNTIEAAKALLSNRNWAFKRTPKYALRPGDGEWRNKSYQVSLDSVWFLELGLVALGGIAMAFAASHMDLGALPILAPYTAAYAFVAWQTKRQSIEGRRA
jgi:cellulose synthase/poly-beta-1,6-N-acetylglucosamine synthase-like glycosyltransferase